MYGIAYLVEDRNSKQPYVIKVIEKKGQMSRPDIYLKYLEEVNNMKKLDHINIVKIYHIFEDT
jgi:serine/threonine protein kinase